MRLDCAFGFSWADDVFPQPIQRYRQSLPSQPSGCRQGIVESVAGDEASHQITGPATFTDELLDLISPRRGKDSVAQPRRHHPSWRLRSGACRPRSVTLAIASSATTPSTANGAATPAASASAPTAAGPATRPTSLERRTAPTARPPPPPRRRIKSPAELFPATWPTAYNAIGARSQGALGANGTRSMPTPPIPKPIVNARAPPALRIMPPMGTALARWTTLTNRSIIPTWPASNPNFSAPSRGKETTQIE